MTVQLPESCGWAFKEWAVICEALAAGRQSLLLRKGGIHEGPQGFQAEHEHFWLYPTGFHQAAENVVPSAADLLARAEGMSPQSPVIPISLLAQVTEVSYLKTLDDVLPLEGEHIWSVSQVEKKFFYRTPGLYLLRLKLFKRSEPWNVPEHPSYAGCKTWVPLESPLSTAGLTSVAAARA